MKLYLLKKKGHKLIFNIKRDSSRSFGMTNDAVISTEGRNLVPVAGKRSLTFVRDDIFTMVHIALPRIIEKIPKF